MYPTTSHYVMGNGIYNPSGPTPVMMYQQPMTMASNMTSNWQAPIPGTIPSNINYMPLAVSGAVPPNSVVHQMTPAMPSMFMNNDVVPGNTSSDKITMRVNVASKPILSASDREAQPVGTVLSTYDSASWAAVQASEVVQQRLRQQQQEIEQQIAQNDQRPDPQERKQQWMPLRHTQRKLQAQLTTEQENTALLHSEAMKKNISGLNAVHVTAPNKSNDVGRRIENAVNARTRNRTMASSISNSLLASSALAVPETVADRQLTSKITALTKRHIVPR